jgi:hypothetical protein
MNSCWGIAEKEGDSIRGHAETARSSEKVILALLQLSKSAFLLISSNNSRVLHSIVNTNHRSILLPYSLSQFRYASRAHLPLADKIFNNEAQMIPTKYLREEIR